MDTSLDTLVILDILDHVQAGAFQKVCLPPSVSTWTSAHHSELGKHRQLRSRTKPVGVDGLTLTEATVVFNSNTNRSPHRRYSARFGRFLQSCSSQTILVETTKARHRCGPCSNAAPSQVPMTRFEVRYFHAYSGSLTSYLRWHFCVTCFRPQFGLAGLFGHRFGINLYGSTDSSLLMSVKITNGEQVHRQMVAAPMISQWARHAGQNVLRRSSLSTPFGKDQHHGQSRRHPEFPSSSRQAFLHSRTFFRPCTWNSHQLSQSALKEHSRAEHSDAFFAVTPSAHKFFTGPVGVAISLLGSFFYVSSKPIWFTFSWEDFCYFFTGFGCHSGSTSVGLGWLKSILVSRLDIVVRSIREIAFDKAKENSPCSAGTERRWQ